MNISPPPATIAADATPFAGLTPDLILDAVDSLDLRSDGRLLALNSYENRVYQLWMAEGSPLIAKFYRPGRWSDARILEEHAFSAELAAAEIPVVPPLLHQGQSLFHYQGQRFALFRKQGGRTPELEDSSTLEWLGRFIGRIHAVGSTRPFVERPTLDLASFGVDSRDYLLANGFIPRDLLPAWQSVADAALSGVAACYQRAGKVALIRLHGDCHPGNLLWTDNGPHFVDFDDARMGPAVQDLWMLLAGDRHEQGRQLSDLLAGYEDFCEFDPRQLHLIEALRTLRLLHYSAWLARRHQDPAFIAAFPWFNSNRYWEERILELREQIPLMEEPPLMV